MKGLLYIYKIPFYVIGAADHNTRKQKYFNLQVLWSAASQLYSTELAPAFFLTVLEESSPLSKDEKKSCQARKKSYRIKADN
jgi:hypothetical protein